MKPKPGRPNDHVPDPRRFTAAIPRRLHDRLSLDALQRGQSVQVRLAHILRQHYAAPPVPDLSAHQRRRLDAAIRNHESLEDVAHTLRLDPRDAYAYLNATRLDPKRKTDTPPPSSLNRRAT